MGKKPILTVLKAEGHSADTGAGKFPLVSMGGRAEDLAYTDPGARTPGILHILVRAALCRRCLTAVGHYFPSLFFSFLVLTAVAKTPEGVVVGFQIFAWAPK